jgi:hypothetical protein
MRKSSLPFAVTFPHRDVELPKLCICQKARRETVQSCLKHSKSGRRAAHIFRFGILVYELRSRSLVAGCATLLSSASDISQAPSDFRGASGGASCISSHGSSRPRHPPCRGAAGSAASTCCVLVCMRHSLGTSEGLRKVRCKSEALFGYFRKPLHRERHRAVPRNRAPAPPGPNLRGVGNLLGRPVGASATFATSSIGFARHFPLQ